MPRSSLGFHTLTLTMLLDEKEARQLMYHFKVYSRDTGLIKIYPVNGNSINLKYKTESDGTQKTSIVRNKNFKVDYYREDIGIEWLIRYNNGNREFKSYSVDVTINPKILGGVKDYITAATIEDMENAISNFNLEAKKISPLLRTFYHFKLSRVDYCINFSLNELAPMCTPERIMALIRRSDIPPDYKEWMTYSDTAHCMKGKPGSFYLTSHSVNINCYSKHVERLECSLERKTEDWHLFHRKNWKRLRILSDLKCSASTEKCTLSPVWQNRLETVMSTSMKIYFPLKYAMKSSMIISKRQLVAGTGTRCRGLYVKSSPTTFVGRRKPV